MSKDYLPLKVFAISIILLLNTFVARAQITQTGSLAILPGSIYIERIPDDFNFPESFVPLTQETINLYKTLDPSSQNQILKVVDADPTGYFDITVSLDEFTSTTGKNNTISYTSTGLVTLSQSLTEPVDAGTNNIPSGAPNIVAPINCNWNPQTGTKMEDICDIYMTNFSQPIGSPSYTSEQIDILSTPVAADTGEYSVGFGFKLSFDDTVVPDNYSSVLTFTLIPSP
jgi:hypothetical protein